MMDERYLSDEERNQIQSFKRAYWTQKGIADEYQSCAYNREAITRTKNVTEIAFVQRYAAGPRVLDAGAGTGRFTMPLRDAGFEVAALDISLEMLSRGMKYARKAGSLFPALVGDIEWLPFRDGQFDSLVSITVLRHFPNWPVILREYLRVVKPRGRLIIDMASKDQRQFIEHHFAPEKDPELERYFDPVSYDTGLAMGELGNLARELDLTVVATMPNDVFNLNPLLEHAFGDELPGFLERLRDVLDTTDAIVLFDLFVKRFLPALSPALAASWLLVLEKAPSNTVYRPPYFDAAEVPATADPEEAVFSILRACLGRRSEGYLRECERALRSDDARALVNLLREEFLPRLPLEALIYKGEQNAP